MLAKTILSLLIVMCGFILSGCQNKMMTNLLTYTHSDECGYYYCAWKELRRNFHWKDWSKYQAVQREIQWFKQHPDHLNVVANNAAPYLHFVLESLKSRKFPGELALLPMVESLYNPSAISYAGAVGLWQIRSGTATDYGVTQNWWFDGKHDLIESTQAALDHIEVLHKRFNQQWLLTLAAYNSGHIPVLKAIKNNKQAGKKTDFWSLSNLPNQTQKHIPKLLALATIIRNPHRYDLKLPILKHEKYFDVVEINTQVSLHEVAKLIDVDANELYKLNPGHKQKITQPQGTHKILLPLEKAQTFTQKFQKSKISKRSFLMQHSIKKGDNLIRLAKKYKVPVQEIKELNQLTNNIIYAGKTLWIPKFLHPSRNSKKGIS